MDSSQNCEISTDFPCCRHQLDLQSKDLHLDASLQTHQSVPEKDRCPGMPKCVHTQFILTLLNIHILIACIQVFQGYI